MEPEHPSLGALVGDWTTEMTHRLLPDSVLRGRSTFELLEGGKFLLQREHLDHPEFPDSSHAVIGGAGADDLRMHYFDSRGVVRIFEMTIDAGVWTFVRSKTDFSPLEFHQRLTWTLSEDGQTMAALGEISQDGVTWEEDINVTYRRT
ncbi:MAG: hypothetical protein ACRDKJ_02015 [Actinomycetota bacterium]